MWGHGHRGRGERAGGMLGSAGIVRLLRKSHRQAQGRQNTGTGGDTGWVNPDTLRVAHTFLFQGLNIGD